MKALCYPRIAGTTQPATQCHIPEYLNPQKQSCEDCIIPHTASFLSELLQKWNQPQGDVSTLHLQATWPSSAGRKLYRGGFHHEAVCWPVKLDSSHTGIRPTLSRTTGMAEEGATVSPDYQVLWPWQGEYNTSRTVNYSAFCGKMIPGTLCAECFWHLWLGILLLLSLFN